jgi:hypothetical protein
LTKTLDEFRAFFVSAEYNKFSFQIWQMKSQQRANKSTVANLAEQSVEVRQDGQKVGLHVAVKTVPKA